MPAPQPAQEPDHSPLIFPNRPQFTPYEDPPKPARAPAGPPGGPAGPKGPKDDDFEWEEETLPELPKHSPGEESL